MKKLMIILVMMLVASGANAQSKKQKTVQKDNMYAVKQAALDALKRSLIAPSQFVLTDYKGNRIGVNGIETPMHIKGSELKEWSDSTYFYKGNKWTVRDKFEDEEPDSIWVYKVVQKPSSSYYAVKIIGDARNRAGGYEQISRIVFVYGEAPYFYGSLDVFRPHIERYYVKTIVCDKKVKKEKSVEKSRGTQSTVEDLFKRIENIEEMKRVREEERKREKEEEKILLEQKEKCKIFATKLRFQGVDVAKLTDEDIDRLDSLRQRHHIKNSYDRIFPNKSLYGLPSAVFKDAMKQERKYYARISKKDATYTCAADSIVYVEPGVYHYNVVKDLGDGYEMLREESRSLFREGSKLTIGRATFICRNKENNNNVKKRKKTKKVDDMYYSKY